MRICPGEKLAKCSREPEEEEDSAHIQPDAFVQRQPGERHLVACRPMLTIPNSNALQGGTTETKTSFQVFIF